MGGLINVWKDRWMYLLTVGGIHYILTVGMDG